MPNKILSQDELQYIEHCNKVLEDHSVLVTKVVNETEQLLNNYVPIISTYVQSINQVQIQFGECVKNVIQSSRQLRIVTGNTQEIITFISQVQKLNEILTPELIEKLRKISKNE